MKCRECGKNVGSRESIYRKIRPHGGDHIPAVAIKAERIYDSGFCVDCYNRR
jgi:hypothetical protein